MTTREIETLPKNWSWYDYPEAWTDIPITPKKPKRLAIPESEIPEYVSPEQAKAIFDVDLRPGWQLHIKRSEFGKVTEVSYITPEKWEILGGGESYISPEGRFITARELEGYLLEHPEFAPREPPFEEPWGAIFPEEDINSMLRSMQIREGATFEEIDAAIVAQDEFIDTLRAEGRTLQTEALLRQLGATEEQLEELFAPVPAPELVVKEEKEQIREFREEGWLKNNIIDPLYVGGVNFIQGLKQTVTSLVPALFADILPRKTMITPGGEVVTIGTGGIPHTEEMWEWRERLASDITRSSQERFLRYVEEDEKWIKAHPELTPKPEYNLNPFKNTELFLDPGYYAFTISSSLAYALSVMGTIAGVTAATGGNVVAGIAAGMGVAGAPEASDMTKELMGMGVPFREAVEWGFLYGATVGGVESVSNLPLLGILFKPVKQATKPFWDTLLKVTANRILKASIVAGVLPTIEGVEEAVTQAAHNAIIKHYDETKSILEGVDQAFIQGVIASLPFAALGGGASYRSFRQALPPETQTELDTLMDGFKEAGATEEEAQVMATNEIAKTPEGESIVTKAIEAAKRIHEEEIGAIRFPERVPEVGRAERKRLAFLREDLARIKREAEAGTIPRPVANKQIEGVNLEIANLEKQLEALPPAVEEVKLPKVTEAEEVSARIGEMEMEVAGLREWLATEPATKLVNLIKKAGWYKGEVSNLTLKQYRDITGKTEILPNILTKDKKHVRWEYALDDIATEMGYKSGEALKTEIERAGESLARIRELEREIAVTEVPKPPKVKPPKGALKPLPPLPDTTAKEATTNLAIPGRPTLTPAQVTRTLSLFGKYITDPSAENAWELTRELRRETRAVRAENLKARSQQLIIKKGVSPEDAIRQAITETMSGELPLARTDYLDDLTQEMRDALFSKVYHTLKEEPFEMMSTTEALTNALLGKPIPRELGIRGGSAYTRLERVFGEQAEVFEAIKKGAKEGKALQNVIEGLYMEVGKPPLPIDPKMADWLRSLQNVPYGIGTIFEKPSDLQVSDLRTSAELEYAQRKLDLDTQLSKGEITKDTYDIEVAQAYAKAYPQPPVPPYEPPIDKAINQMPMFPRPAMDNLIRVLKEIGWSPIDIGNFLRANKASFDMSFWRQQGPLIVNHPVSFVQANIEAWKALWSQKSAEASWERISRDPLYQIYEVGEARGFDFLRPLELKKGTSQWRGVEEFGYLTGERAIPRLTQKIPWVKLSARAFVTGTNEHNWRIFKNHYGAMLKLNEKIASGEIKLKPGEAFSVEKEMVDMARMLADFTQRASLGKVAGLAPALNSLIFAPRATLGRFLTPRHLVSANPRIRIEAWRNLTTWVASIGGIVLLGLQLGLWEVEKDPHSAEFMSIRIGNIRLDPWSGYRQFLVFYTRIVTGLGLSSVTGAEYETDPIRAMTTFVRGKAAPLASIILDFWTGRNFIGEEVDVVNKRQWAERIAPFAVWDIYEAYMEDPIRALQVAIPAIVGAGVQTYTGDWIENFPKLGLPKYSDNLVYGITEPVYDVKDFWSDTSSQFAGVDPATLTEEKGYPAYIRGIAEARIVNEYLKTLPNEKLHLMNTDPKEGTTFAQYYEMWRDREKLVAAGDDAELTKRELQPDGTYKKVVYKGEDALKAFDADEKTRNAHLGNFSQRQFSLLNQYHAITDKEKQAEFLKVYKDEIGINPRQLWLTSNPKENAQLAVWGQADAFTQAAYDETQRLIKEFDIPDVAVVEYLPPKDVAKTHFTYLETGEEFGWNSWETKLVLAKDDVYREWLGREPIETPVRSLELKIKHRELFEQYEALETDEERAELKTSNPQWVDDMRRIEAIELDASDTQIEAWVERGRVVDEFGAGSSEAKVWLWDNDAIWNWARWKELLTDDGSDWNVPVLRLNVKMRKQDDEYEALETDEEREAFLYTNTEYYKGRKRRDAYRIEDFPEDQIETYVDWYTDASLKRPEDWDEKLGWYEEDWWLQEHSEFHQAMVDLYKVTEGKHGWKELRDFSEVPTREVFKLYLIYRGLPKGDTREDYRAQHLDLDRWLVVAFGYTPVGTRGDETADISVWEELARKSAEIKKALEELMK